jgi:hypothetical protein
MPIRWDEWAFRRLSRTETDRVGRGRVEATSILRLDHRIFAGGVGVCQKGGDARKAAAAA